MSKSRILYMGKQAQEWFRSPRPAKRLNLVDFDSGTIKVASSTSRWLNAAGLMKSVKVGRTDAILRLSQAAFIAGWQCTGLNSIKNRFLAPFELASRFLDREEGCLIVSDRGSGSGFL